MVHLRDGLARGWADHLADTTGLPVYATRRQGRPEPPYTVVTVKRLNALPGCGGAVFLAEVRIVHVSDASDAPPEDHGERLRLLHREILDTPAPATDPEHGVTLHGFELTGIEQADGRDDDGRNLHAEVFLLTAGVS